MENEKEEKKLPQNNQASSNPFEESPENSTSTNSNPFDQETSADTSSQNMEEQKSTPDPSPSSPSSGLFSISTKTENRSLLAGIWRWGNKKIGGATSELAGLGTIGEKKRTEAILQQCAQVLSTNNATLAPALQKQYLERIMSANTIALAIIEMLQAYNAEESVTEDTLTVTQNAQTLLDMHKDTTLPPTISEALAAQLKTARATIGKNCHISSEEKNPDQ